MLNRLDWMPRTVTAMRANCAPRNTLNSPLGARIEYRFNDVRHDELAEILADFSAPSSSSTRNTLNSPLCARIEYRFNDVRHDEFAEVLTDFSAAT